jgi:uncharacterized coiled-coil DUF342 family protein
MTPTQEEFDALLAERDVLKNQIEEMAEAIVELEDLCDSLHEQVEDLEDELEALKAKNRK